jgi:hypothetical protein
MMSRDDANALIQNLAKTLKAEETALNEKGFAGLSVGVQELFFELHESEGVLECNALIYRFREPPRPGVLEGFQAELSAGTDAGGGTLDFEPESQSLFLTREYRTRPSDPEFASDLQRLLAAGETWGREVLQRVAARVFHPADLRTAP